MVIGMQSLIVWALILLSTQLIAKLVLPVQRNTGTEVDPHNQLNCLRLNDGSPDGAEFWDFGWFNHLHQAKTGYISRSGLYRVLAFPFVLKIMLFAM